MNQSDRRKKYRRKSDVDLVMEAKVCRNERDINALSSEIKAYKTVTNGKMTAYERSVIKYLGGLVVLLSILGTIVIYIAK